MVITVRPTTSVRKNPRKIHRPATHPIHFAAYFTRQNPSLRCVGGIFLLWSLVGARPLHLACARPFGRLKAPLGLSLLRCASQTRSHPKPCSWFAPNGANSNGVSCLHNFTEELSNRQEVKQVSDFYAKPEKQPGSSLKRQRKSRLFRPSIKCTSTTTIHGRDLDKRVNIP